MPDVEMVVSKVAAGSEDATLLIVPVEEPLAPSKRPVPPVVARR